MEILPSDLIIVKNYYPDSAGILLTFKCNAMCEECCFECGPKNPFTLTKEKIKNIIDQLTKMKSVKFIVWTGGEAFLNYNLLLFALDYAYRKGLHSRIVSNGFWAKNKNIAKRKLQPLIERGLTELNISTGDNHQEYVSIDNALTAAISAVELGILAFISVEATGNSSFKEKDIYDHDLYKELEKTDYNRELFQIASTVWVSFHKDKKYTYNYEKPYMPELENGCDGLFQMINIDPKNIELACCGLSVEYIKELQLGDICEKDNTLINLYNTQKEDFMKQWLYIDGPIRILQKVKEWDDSIENKTFVHFCQTCAYIFNTPKIQKVIKENYTEIYEDVQKRFVNKIKLNMYLNELTK
ncbi:radical SAM protein [Enterococcus faecalis]|uniref:radical SAM protein n=1 Tax=Enterococcus faecalis TaxID=1351 RepID=UPI001883425E|nr:radical SAM protein [Enterococcus faecalis]MBF0004023.1 radical SAM protein [Enterococcus faecalis]MBF0006706.1 radical SAM protein [Enterococcus faecalis]HCT9166896.1 radical SAM protein [Enterococcus faecalis]